MTDNKHTAFIFARGGSKGIKDKNIKPVAGKPLLAHAIECAQASASIDRVFVSTDSEKIADVASDFGAEILMRPGEIAGDTSPEILAWRHAVDNAPGLQMEALFISIPATAPLRQPVDVDNAIARYKKGDCDIVMGISASHRNPYLNMVTVNENGYIKVMLYDPSIKRRQDAPVVYDITTCVYVSGFDYIRSCSSLMEGKVGYVEIPPERALDIDEEFDLYLADMILRYPFNKNNQG